MTHIYTGPDCHLYGLHGPIDWPETGPFRPRMPDEIVKMCRTLVGRSFATVSEIVILWFAREIRAGRLRTDEVRVDYCDNGITTLHFDTRGEVIECHPDLFLHTEVGFDLRFHNHTEY